MKRKVKRTTRLLTVALVLALLGAFVGTAPAAQASPAVRAQVAFVIDGSGSISTSEWNLMIGGLAAAIKDPGTLPHNGTVELWAIQFAGTIATLEIDRTLIDSSATADAFATALGAIVKRGGYTPTGAGIEMAKDEIVEDMNPEARQFINLITNGYPQPTAQVAYAIEQRNLAIAAGIDEIDAEAIGVTDEWRDWLRDNIVYPEPGVLAPPYPDPPGSQGWVRQVATFEEFAEAISDKFARIFPRLTLDPITATNYVGETHTVTACYTEDGVPVAGQVIHFEVLSGPHAGTTGSGTTDATGCTTWSYVGTASGTDSIDASTDTNDDGIDDLFSQVVTKIWEIPPELTLEPPDATNCYNRDPAEHTVIATYRVNAIPQPGYTVDFLITDGPNAGLSGSDVTDAAGEATWTYGDTGGTDGTDTIQASVDTGEKVLTVFATKNWIFCGGISGVSIWSSLLGAAALIGLAMVMVRRREKLTRTSSK